MKNQSASQLGLACCLLFAAGPAFAQVAQRLSLHDAEQRALSNHPAVRAADYNARAADAAVQEARSAYFPSVSASLTGTQAESGSRVAAGGLNNPIILDRLAGGIAVGPLGQEGGQGKAGEDLPVAHERPQLVPRCWFSRFDPKAAHSNMVAPDQAFAYDRNPSRLRPGVHPGR